MVANDYITGAQFAVMMARRLDESFRVVPTPPIGVSPGFLKQRYLSKLCKTRKNKKNGRSSPIQLEGRI